jgi:hypothetical protein
MGEMISAPRWTAEELERDRTIAIEEFRKQRLAESAERSAAAYEDYSERFGKLFAATDALTCLERSALDDLEIARYLTAPPISADDLKVLADVESIAPSRIAADDAIADRLLNTIRHGLDAKRFPWVRRGDRPSDAERHAALVASSSLAASQRVATNRRNQSKDEQEEAVRQCLRQAHFQQVPAVSVQSIGQAPEQGHFCSECLVGTRQADILVCTYDHRMVPIECKVSNSSTNSIKRLNNDAAVKAEVWRKDFGERHVVPTAVLSGVYKLHNLLEAQERGLFLLWAHNLQPLTDWLERTRAP